LSGLDERLAEVLFIVNVDPNVSNAEIALRPEFQKELFL